MTPLYAGIGGVVRELTEMDAGINGVVTPLTEMWAGVGGVQRQIFSSAFTAEIYFDQPEAFNVFRARIEGTSYTDKEIIVPFTKGAGINVVILYNSSLPSNFMKTVLLDGERVASRTGKEALFYDFTPTGSVIIQGFYYEGISARIEIDHV